MLWIDQGENRRSQAFLARTFSIKTREDYFVRKEEQKRKKRRPCGNWRCKAGQRDKTSFRQRSTLSLNVCSEESSAP